MKSKIAKKKSVLQIFLKFGSKHDSAHQISFKNFIIGCTEGFRAILDQRQVFSTLDENWIAHAVYLCTHSCDTMHRMRESKSKLKLFYRLFMDLFCHISLAPGLNTCLKAGFLTSILTSGTQPKHTLLSHRKTIESHLKVTISSGDVVVWV